MATHSKFHILQRIVPFEGDAFSLPELNLANGDSKALEGYFQILHLDPLRWLKSESAQLGFAVAGEGHIELRVRRLVNSQTTVLFQGDIELESKHKEIVFEIPRSQMSGVAVIELRGLTPSRIREAAWGIYRAPSEIGHVHAGVVCCTFNRQKEIVRTISSLRSTEAFRAGKLDLFVVDNADNLLLPNELHCSRVHLVAQRNFGGAGGFTRGLIEASSHETLTHVLFMDDDIELIPEVVDRLERWLAILPSSVAISGGMLDGLRRTVLYEAGARFETHPFDITPGYNNVSLAEHDSALASLSKESPTDYGAWWFFAFSREAVNTVGLPLPVFIRGDDIEFGIRLKKNDMHTQVIHGIAVWHEPFHAKASAWQMYYAIRNLSLVNALHFATPLSVYLPTVARMFLQFILRYDYGAAAAIERGLRDFLKGPSFLLNPGDETHKGITQVIATYEHQKLNAQEAASIEVDELLKPGIFSKLWRTVTVSGHFLPYRQSKPQLMEPGYVSWRALQRDSYVQINPYTKTGALFTKRPRLFWPLVLRMTMTVLRALFVFPRRCQQYRSALKELSSERSWRSYLNITRVANQ